MLDLTADQEAALAAGHVIRRLFVWVDALDPVTGDPDPGGVWDGLGDVTIGDRTYKGSGTLVSISSVASVGDFSIPGLTVTLSGVSAEAGALVNDRAVGQRPMEVLLGIYDTATRALLPPLIRRFVGFVDQVEVTTPEAGGQATITLTCESTSRALTIKRTDRRSHASQQQRQEGDRFFQYVSGQREKRVWFGTANPKPGKSDERAGTHRR